MLQRVVGISQHVVGISQHVVGISHRDSIHKDFLGKMLAADSLGLEEEGGKRFKVGISPCFKVALLS